LKDGAIRDLFECTPLPFQGSEIAMDGTMDRAGRRGHGLGIDTHRANRFNRPIKTGLHRLRHLDLSA
jgi:hypothetical protein